MYVTAEEFADVGGAHWPAPCLFVAQGLISVELGQEESVTWFSYVLPL